MITDEEIQKTIDWLRDHAKPAAQARANRIYLEEFRKSLKGQLMKEHQDLPVSAQEREAYADTRYKDYLKTLQDAIEKDEHHRFLREAGRAKIEAWRSFSANHRATGL